MSNAALNAVFWYSQAKSGELNVMLAIADGINDDTGTTPPRQETLAAKSHMSVRRLRDLLERLVSKGELVIVEHHARPGIYAIPMLYGEDGYDPQPCEEQHFCNGYHTPLYVTRANVTRKRRDERRKAAPRPRRATVRGGTPLPAEAEPLFRQGEDELSTMSGTPLPADENELSTVGTPLPPMRNAPSGNGGTPLPAMAEEDFRQYPYSTQLFTQCVPGTPPFSEKKENAEAEAESGPAFPTFRQWRHTTYPEGTHVTLGKQMREYDRQKREFEHAKE